MRKLNRKDKNSRDTRQSHRCLVIEALERRICLTVPAFSSLPGADHTLFLDFDGQTVQGTSWNGYYNQTTLTAQPYDIDGNPASFSATELARIEESWQRTAEDFRPFNINVTTVDPGVEALRKSGAGDSQWGVRVVVTKESTMVNDPAEYCGCGGIAYIDSFNWSSDTPVWVYTTGGKSIAEAASHEAGHSLGLSHDGLTSGTTYYQGHGSGETGWASIMGVGYYQNVTQWDKGEYFNSNNGGASANYGDGPDDLALIVGAAGPGNGFSYRADDHGDTNLAATSLGLSSATAVADGGVIETTDDVDVFTFTTGSGLVTLDIDPFTPGPNLDVKAELYDGAGSLVATSNSSATLSAGFSVNLSSGQYFLHVDGTGWGTPGANPPSGFTEYASLGQYSISGSIVDPGGLPAVSIGDATADEDAGTITFALTLSAAAAAGTSVDWSTSDGSATAGLDYVAVSSSTAFFAAGETTAQVTVTLTGDSLYEGDEDFSVNLANPSGLVIGDGQGAGTIVDNDPPPNPTVSIGDASVNEGKYNNKGKNPGPQLTDMTFAITLSASSTQTITVNYSTADGTATTADNDYQFASGTVTFNPGQTSKTMSVTIIGDNTQEGDEDFRVDLSNASNADLGDATATGTIVGDDTKTKGGRGGGGGGKPPKSRSEAAPVAIADPIWFFEGPESGFDHGGEHGELQADDHELVPAFNPLPANSGPLNAMIVTTVPVDGRIHSVVEAKEVSRQQLVDLVMRDVSMERSANSRQHDSPARHRLAELGEDDSTDLDNGVLDNGVLDNGVLDNGVLDQVLRELELE